MAHFIKLHTVDGSEVLFNLDVVVSVDPISDGSTIICTRWGNTKVKESLDTILTLSKSTVVDAGNSQLLNE